MPCDRAVWNEAAERDALHLLMAFLPQTVGSHRHLHNVGGSCQGDWQQQRQRNVLDGCTISNEQSQRFPSI